MKIRHLRNINKFFLQIIFLLFISNLAFAQQFEKKEQSYRKIIISSKDSIIVANILTRNKGSKIEDNLVYYWYNSNKINSNKGAYYGKLLNGEYKVFNQNGGLVTAGNFKQGLKSGSWKTWYRNGELKTVSNFKNGLLNGKYNYFDNNGKLILSENYKNNLKSGRQYYFFINERKVSRYRNGKEVKKNWLKIEKRNSKKRIEEKNNPTKTDPSFWRRNFFTKFKRFDNKKVNNNDKLNSDTKK